MAKDRVGFLAHLTTQTRVQEACPPTESGILAWFCQATSNKHTQDVQATLRRAKPSGLGLLKLHPSKQLRFRLHQDLHSRF